MSTQEWYVKAQEAHADIPEATLDALRWADGITWGMPTRFGNMPAQVKQFIDTAGAVGPSAANCAGRGEKVDRGSAGCFACCGSPLPPARPPAPIPRCAGEGET